MKHTILGKICTVIIFAVSIILSWGGMIYAINDPDQFKVTGILVSFIGYGILFWAVLRYENTPEDQT